MQAQNMQAMISALWERSRHTVAERAQLLQSAVRTMERQPAGCGDQAACGRFRAQTGGGAGHLRAAPRHRSRAGGRSALWTVNVPWQSRDGTAAGAAGGADPADRPRTQSNCLKWSYERPGARLGPAAHCCGISAARRRRLAAAPGAYRSSAGQLPGDISYRGRNLSVYFPLGTSILLSVVLSLIFYLLSRFRR